MSHASKAVLTLKGLDCIHSRSLPSRACFACHVCSDFSGMHIITEDNEEHDGNGHGHSDDNDDG